MAESFRGGVLDPTVRVAEGKACIVDSAIDRSDRRGLLKFVQQKYGRPTLIDTDEGYHAVWGRINVEDPAGR